MPQTSTSEETEQAHLHRESTDGINLMQGESVLANRRPSWTLWWKQIALAVFILLVGISSDDGAAGGIFVAGAILAYVVLARMQSRYIVTDERVKIKLGLLSKVSREYRVSDLNSLTTTQSIFERILGHGTIVLRTASNDEVVWHGVPEYEQVASTIREEQRKYD